MVEEEEGVRMFGFSTESSEKALLGAVFLAGEKVFYEAESLGVKDEHFSQPGNRMLWRVFKDGLSRGVNPDVRLIYEKHEEEISRFGGFSWLSSFAGQCGSLSHVPSYVDRVVSGHRRSRVLHAARLAIEAGQDPKKGASEIHAILEDALKESASEMGMGTQLETAEDIVMDWAGRRQSVLEGTAESDELSWDIHALDRFVAAGPGHLVVVGGRPKMGKSQLALSIMANVSRKYGPTLFCSAEMGRDALARRILSSSIDIKTSDPKAFAQGVANVFSEWVDVPMYFDYKARSFQAVSASIRFAHRKYGIKAAAVDYLQLLEMDGARTEEEEIGRASKGFKNLAEDLGIPIVLLVQVNRRCEERADKRPVMSDIRGSGRVEQDADAVVFVYREAYYNERFARPSQVELLVRANRHGPSGTGIAFWRPGGGWFRDPTPWESLGKDPDH
jgi:replicative DNA helicase